jgi:hypothetical protein
VELSTTYLCMGHTRPRTREPPDYTDRGAMRGEGASIRRRRNGSTVPPGDAHLGDRVHLTTLLREGRTEFGDVHDVVFCPRRELRTSLLSLSGHWRLVHVEHVQRHLDHAEGEPKKMFGSCRNIHVLWISTSRNMCRLKRASNEGLFRVICDDLPQLICP